MNEKQSAEYPFSDKEYAQLHYNYKEMKNVRLRYKNYITLYDIQRQHTIIMATEISSEAYQKVDNISCAYLHGRYK